MNRIKKGDTVKIISGNYKGQSGRIIKMIYSKNRAIVEGINKAKKHQKPDNNQAGGIIEKEMPIHISNLAYYDNSLKKGIRLGFKFNDKNKKIRINKANNKEV